MTYMKVGDDKAAALIPVIGTILSFSPEEREAVAIDEGFLLGQTLGSWGWRSGAEPAA